MEKPTRVEDDIAVLPSFFPVPGFGVIPVNAFLLKAQQPVLVDTGLIADRQQFMENLRSLIDLEDLRWIWLTHPDQDHIGSIHQVLREAPQVKVITTFLGVGIMSLFDPLPMDRVYFLNPGQSIDVGDRRLTAVKPPTFDNPATTGFYDSKSGAFFSSDCFGALLSRPVVEITDVSRDELRQGQSFWATVDSPWLHKVDEAKFARELKSIEQMEPKVVLSAHLPPARGMTSEFLRDLAAAPNAQPFVGPDQAALEQMVAQMTGAGAQ